MGCYASLFCKYPGEMELTHIGFLSQLLQRKVFSEMFIDIGNGIRYSGIAELPALIFCGRKQKVVQKAGNVAGELSFQNCGGGSEDIVNLKELLLGRYGILRNKGIAVGGNNFFIKCPGKDAVKMHPQGIPLFGTSVAVRLVAIKQHELSFLGSEGLAGNRDVTLPL